MGLSRMSDDARDVTVSHYSDVVDGKERFGVELLIGGEATAAEPLDGVGQ